MCDGGPVKKLDQHGQDSSRHECYIILVYSFILLYISETLWALASPKGHIRALSLFCSFSLSRGHTKFRGAWPADGQWRPGVFFLLREKEREYNAKTSKKKTFTARGAIAFFGRLDTCFLVSVYIIIYKFLVCLFLSLDHLGWKTEEEIHPPPVSNVSKMVDIWRCHGVSRCAKLVWFF